MAAKQWISERRDWITTVTAALALALAIAALVVGLAAGGGPGSPRFADGSGPPQGAVGTGQMMPPGVPAGPGSQGFPDSDSGSSAPDPGSTK
jgi:hypothetical protein